MISSDGSKNDIDLTNEIGPGQKLMSKTLVTSVFEEIKTIASGKWAEVWSDAIQHEKAYHNFSSDVDRDIEVGRSGKPGKNLIRLLVSGYNSRLQEAHAQHKAYPTHAEAADIKSADLANVYLDFWRRDQNFFEREYEFGQNGQLHGTAFWKVFWNTEIGEELLEPVFDDVGAPVMSKDTGDQEVEVLGREGGVTADIFTVFNACFGPTHRIEDAEWCLFRNFVSRDAALGLLDDAALHQDLLPAPKDFQTVSMGEAAGYEVWELWYKKGKRFPNGLFVKILGEDIVLSSTSFPYKHGQLPIAVWQPDFVANRPFGTSHVFDSFPLQQKLNLAESKKDELMNRMAGVIMTAPADLVEEIEEGNLLVPVNDSSQANLIQFKSLNNIPSLITDRSADLQRDMFDLGQQNEILAGFESLKSGTAAKSYEFLAEADRKKMSASIARYRSAMLRRDRMALWLFQEFATTARKVLVLGDGNQPYVEVFNGIDIDGTDVVMEPILGADFLRSTKAGAAPENAQLGTLDPSSVAEVSVTGLDTTIDEAQRKQQLRNAVLSGGEPDPTIDPLVALGELNLFSAAGGVADPAVISKFKDFYTQQLQQQQQQAQQPKGQAQ